MTYATEETSSRCPESSPLATKVGDGERISRMLVSSICGDDDLPDEKTFQLDELLCRDKPSKTQPDCDCGNSGGVSVQRCPPKDERDHANASLAFANRRPGRRGLGIARTTASVLREIRIDQIDGQIIFVLPDGSGDDPGHAVIRLRLIPEGLAKKVRKELIDIFRKDILRPDEV